MFRIENKVEQSESAESDIVVVTIVKTKKQGNLIF